MSHWLIGCLDDLHLQQPGDLPRAELVECRGPDNSEVTLYELMMMNTGQHNLSKVTQGTMPRASPGVN